MVTTAEYRDVIQRILKQYAALLESQPLPGVETLLVFDTERDQYLWLQVGWTARGRTYGVTVHIRLRDEKVIVEQDWTENGIANDLVRAGVPVEAIELGFHEPADGQELTEAMLLAR